MFANRRCKKMTHIPKHCLIECSGLFILGRMHLHIPVLAIDGPSGSGKGTISRAVARALGWHFLDSGALYRVVGLAAMHANADLDSEAVLARTGLRSK
jgi:hypothetical protein